VVHDHFYLKEEFNLMGIHLSHHNPTPPPDYHDTITQTCYTLDEIEQIKAGRKYVILKNVYDSISEPNYVARFTEQDLRMAARQGIVDKHVMAQGGIALENIHLLQEYGFGGVVIRGDLWKRFNIHKGFDFKDLIAHFRKLRQATI